MFDYLCLSGKCREIEDIQNGESSPKRNGQEVVEYSFSCNTGYELNGPQTIECQENGQWSSNPPFCERK